MFHIQKLPFPVRPDALPARAPLGWLPLIAGLESHQIVALLKNRWSSFQAPYLQRLSAAILDRELLSLSIDERGTQWLTFGDHKHGLHVAPPARLPDSLRAKFPFERIPGLADFLENFGGLADGHLPPCPWFVPFEDCRVVARECDIYDWGLIGRWAGSLTLYNTCSGNFIVLSPDNVCVKWDHDIGWSKDDEDPFEPLHWTMSEMVNAFLAYHELTDEDALRESPFYY